MMNLAFAGLRHGHILALYAAAAARDDVNVVGAWEEDPAARAAAAQTVKAPFYADYDALLEDKRVDTVAVGDYYGARGQRILKALARGKRVISDKPVCTDMKELEDIRALSLKVGRGVTCMLDLRYDPAVNTARSLVRRGVIGRVLAADFTGQHPLDWGKRPMWYFEEGKHGGVINDIAIHGLDALTYITGQEFARPVAARCWNAFARHAPQFLDCAQFMCEYDGGMGVAADVSYAAPDGCGYSLPSYWRFNLWGEEGAVEFRYGGGELTLSLRNKGIETIPCEPYVGDALTDSMRPFDAEAQEALFRSQAAALTLQAAAMQ